MKKVLLIMLACIALVACKQEAKPSWLYVLHAPVAKVTKTSNNEFILTAKGSRMTAFTDRPQRIVNKITPKYFVDNWTKGSDSFAADNPNTSFMAELDLKNGNKDMEYYIVLSHAKFNAKDQTIAFKITSLNDKELQPGVFRHLVLFIDGGGFGGSVGNWTA